MKVLSEAIKLTWQAVVVMVDTFKSFCDAFLTGAVYSDHIAGAYIAIYHQGDHVEYIQAAPTVKCQFCGLSIAPGSRCPDCGGVTYGSVK